MNKILLINRLNPEDKNNLKKKMFFLLGEMNFSATESRLKETLDKINILKEEDIVFKYNGVELNLLTQEIPNVIKILLDNNFLIYSIYETYTPEL